MAYFTKIFGEQISNALIATNDETSITQKKKKKKTNRYKSKLVINRLLEGWNFIWPLSQKPLYLLRTI